MAQIRDYQTIEVQPQPVETLTTTNPGLPASRYRTLCIAGGRKDKVRPGDILGALTGDAGIDAQAIGKIQVLDYAAYVAVESAVARQALGRLNNGRIKGRRFK